jgi:hypothetical protein
MTGAIGATVIATLGAGGGGGVWHPARNSPMASTGAMAENRRVIRIYPIGVAGYGALWRS